MFKLTEYIKPDFSEAKYMAAPDARCVAAPADGVMPDDFYSTTIYPEYFKLAGKWTLIENARMDCCAVVRDGRVYAVEARNIKRGDAVIVGREEDLSNGVLIHSDGFVSENAGAKQAFAFRAGSSRETSSSKDYDMLAELLEYEKENGYIVWVLGPAVDFDRNSRAAMAKLIRAGYVDALFGGNALGTHDLEAALFHTALGQDIYTKELVYNGHYNHLEAINRARKAGSIKKLIETEHITDGILAACTAKNVPYVLAGSIRDDGPLPGVISDVYEAQSAMREHTVRATTVIGLATQLHTIATGNLTPSWANDNGEVRPVYFYNIDISEFAVNKLRDRGSLSVRTLVTNVQDFLVNLTHSLKDRKDVRKRDCLTQAAR